MGICASCLGLNRHPSHDQDETDRLPNDAPIAQYGALEIEDEEEEEIDPHQDEQEVRREREALEQISNRAADNMIDVLHADHVESGQHLTPNMSFLSLRGLQRDQHKLASHAEQTDQEIEQAWLKDVQAGDLEHDATVKGSYNGNLVIDLGRLRQGNQNSRREQ